MSAEYTRAGMLAVAVADLEALLRSPDCRHPERIQLDIRRLRRRRRYLEWLDRRDP